MHEVSLAQSIRSVRKSEGKGGMSRILFYGAPVDLLSMEETVGIAEAAMRDRSPVRHTALNVAKLVKMRGDSLLSQDVCSSDIVGIDGAGIAWGVSLFGAGPVERVAGVDLFLNLLALCAQTGRRPYILGARQDILERAMDEARRRYPGLEFAGSRNGYFKPAEEERIVADIRASAADALFVAMPTPHKERFLKAHASALEIPFIMGIGGSVDVLAGHISRAPGWMQATGLEWFHRMVKEPRKMIARYASTNSAYAWWMLRSLLLRRNPIERVGKAPSRDSCPV